MNRKKIYESLHEVHPIKQKQIKKISRAKRSNSDEEKRVLGLHFGSIWGIEDSSVPFDSKREKEEIKDSLRPSLALETPNSFEDYNLVEMAPGTSREHPVGINYPTCLRADNLSELNKTTYFLIYLKWTSVQKKLIRRFCELSTEQKKLLNKIL